MHVQKTLIPKMGTCPNRYAKTGVCKNRYIHISNRYISKTGICPKQGMCPKQVYTQKGCLPKTDTQKQVCTEIKVLCRPKTGTRSCTNTLIKTSINIKQIQTIVLHVFQSRRVPRFSTPGALLVLKAPPSPGSSSSLRRLIASSCAATR